eukprot:5691074-Pleurochrysis_carterae.AAC.1
MTTIGLRDKAMFVSFINDVFAVQLSILQKVLSILKSSYRMTLRDVDDPSTIVSNIIVYHRYNFNVLIPLMISTYDLDPKKVSLTERALLRGSMVSVQELKDLSLFFDITFRDVYGVLLAYFDPIYMMREEHDLVMLRESILDVFVDA